MIGVAIKWSKQREIENIVIIQIPRTSRKKYRWVTENVIKPIRNNVKAFKLF